MRKLNDGIEPLANQIMTVSLGLIQSFKASTVLEDAFLVVGTMAAALETKSSITPKGSDAVYSFGPVGSYVRETCGGCCSIYCTAMDGG